DLLTGIRDRWAIDLARRNVIERDRPIEIPHRECSGIRRERRAPDTSRNLRLEHLLPGRHIPDRRLQGYELARAERATGLTHHETAVWAEHRIRGAAAESEAVDQRVAAARDIPEPVACRPSLRTVEVLLNGVVVTSRGKDPAIGTEGQPIDRSTPPTPRRGTRSRAEVP